MVQVETQRPFHLSPSELRSENRSWTPPDTDHFPHASPRSVQREQAATFLLGFSLRVLGPDPPYRVTPSPESVTGSGCSPVAVCGEAGNSPGSHRGLEGRQSPGLKAVIMWGDYRPDQGGQR